MVLKPRFIICALLIFAGTILVFASSPLPPTAIQDDMRNYSLLPEAVIRKSAIETPLPVYPAEAVERNISGVIRIRLTISAEGKVEKIKVKPRTNPILARAVADAVSRWIFEPWIGPGYLPRAALGRLGFRFEITDGEGHVSMYDPQPEEIECLGCSNSGLEFRQWREWPEVPLKNPDGRSQ
jgi:TonB family protein